MSIVEMTIVIFRVLQHTLKFYYIIETLMTPRSHRQEPGRHNQPWTRALILHSKGQLVWTFKFGIEAATRVL